MKCPASLTAQDSYVTVSNPGGGGGLDKSNEMSDKLDCTGLYVTVSNPGGGG